MNRSARRQQNIPKIHTNPKNSSSGQLLGVISFRIAYCVLLPGTTGICFWREGLEAVFGPERMGEGVVFYGLDTQMRIPEKRGWGTRVEVVGLISTGKVLGSGRNLLGPDDF